MIVVAVVKAQKVTFYSSEFEDGVREYLGLGETDDVLQSHTDAITMIDLSGLGITDIRDVVYLPNVTELNLSGNEICDLSPLLPLEKLSVLDVSSNELEDVSVLAFSSSARMTVYLESNYIEDFSYLFGPTACELTIVGMNSQKAKNAPFSEVYHLYTYFVEEGKPVVVYRGYTNIEGANSISYGSSNIQAKLDGDSYMVVLPETPTETTVVTLTNGGQTETTYIVPLADFKVLPGKTVTMDTGLPEGYYLNSVYASEGKVEIVDNTIKYTAPQKAVSDIVDFSFYQGSTLKGLSRFYLNRIKKGDVNGDGTVDKIDLDLVVSYIMNPSDDFNKDAADMNNDNKVDAADLVLLIKKVKP